MTYQIPPRAIYAANPAASRGRVHLENTSPMKTEFQRDRDRIIHSAAFRKLKQKTQVFVSHMGDYYRTRLTHSLEVAQIARAIARALGLDEDLAESLALAHDLGHTPFGHAGEEALHECMQPYGGFNHNDQSLRILTQLERRYAAFDGLNLTWETLEGVVKHNGPLLPLKDSEKLPITIQNFQNYMNLELGTYASAEAQVAALADDIAYNNHDIDDGLRAGLFGFDDIRDLPIMGPILERLQTEYPKLAKPRLIFESVRRMIDVMVTDLLAESRRRIEQLHPQSVDDIRHAKTAVIAFSGGMQQNIVTLREFLMQRMYRHYTVNRMTSKARQIVRDLFDKFMTEPECLPTEWAAMIVDQSALHSRARIICDYIAGMTDNYAELEWQRLFEMKVKS
jgi:dGTPase